MRPRGGHPKLWTAEPGVTRGKAAGRSSHQPGSDGSAAEALVMRSSSVVSSALSLLTLLLVSIIIFAMLEVLPGDVASRILGRDATPESLAPLRAQLHLEDPAPQRYLDWLGGILRGDFGKALTSSRPDRDPGATDLQHPRPLGRRVPPLSAAGAHPGADPGHAPGRPARPRAFGDHTGPAVDPGLPARDAAADRLRHHGPALPSDVAGRPELRVADICAPLPCPR